MRRVGCEPRDRYGRLSRGVQDRKIGWTLRLFALRPYRHVHQPALVPSGERFDGGQGDIDPHPAFMWILAQSAKLVNPSGMSALAAAIRFPASGPKYVYSS